MRKEAKLQYPLAALLSVSLPSLHAPVETLAARPAADNPYDPIIDADIASFNRALQRKGLPPLAPKS